MPRFDPPQYLMEHDHTRLREAQHALVNVRGHYLGELASFAGASNAPMTTAEKKAVLRKNRAQAQREIEKRLPAPGVVTVNPDGSLHLVNPLTPMNRAMADLMRPAHGAIDASPLSAALKTKLKNQPVTFFVDLFDPVLNGIRDALVEVMEKGISPSSDAFKSRTTKDRGGPTGAFVYDLSTPPFVFTLGNPAFREVNIWLYQPGDDLFDDESQGIILRMRMLLAYFVLFFRRPVELQATLLKKGLEFLFGKDDTKLVRIDVAADGTSLDKPRAVDSFPADVAGPFSATRAGVIQPTIADVNGDKLVWKIPQNNRTGQKQSFVTLTAKGWADRKAALRRSWDAQYSAFVQDFKFWHPDFATRVGYVVNVERKSEAAALEKVANEYNLKGRFAQQGPGGKFAINAGTRYGGGLSAPNGPRNSGALNGFSGLGSLGSLGAEPVTTATTVATTKVAADAGTAAGGGEAATAVIGAWCTGIASIVTAVGGATAAIILAVNKPEVAAAEAKEADARAREAAAKAEEGKAAAASASASTAPLLLGGAALLAFFIYKNRQGKKG